MSEFGIGRVMLKYHAVLKRVRKEGSTKTVLKSAVSNLESVSGMVAAKPGRY